MTRKQRARALPFQEAAFRLYVEHSPLALMLFDADLRVVGWSERATAMFGWTEDDVLGKPLAELDSILEDDRPQVAAFFGRLAAGPVAWRSNTTRNRCRDGTAVHTRWFNAYLSTADFTGFVAVGEDISDAALAREAATETQERLSELFDATPDGLAFFDLDGTYHRLNPSSEQMMGVNRAHLIGRSFGDFVIPPTSRSRRAFRGRPEGRNRRRRVDHRAPRRLDLSGRLRRGAALRARYDHRRLLHDARHHRA